MDFVCTTSAATPHWGIGRGRVTGGVRGPGPLPGRTPSAANYTNPDPVLPGGHTKTVPAAPNLSPTIWETIILD
jgi:hypothetical protein